MPTTTAPTDLDDFVNWYRTKAAPSAPADDDDLDSFTQNFYRANGAPKASKAGDDDDLDSFVKNYKPASQLKTPIPFAWPIPGRSLSDSAAKLGQPLTALTPPPQDTSTTPINVFSGEAQAPGMRTEEEKAQLGTISARPKKQYYGYKGVPTSQGTDETVGEVARRVVPRAFRDQPQDPNDMQILHPEGLMSPEEQRENPVTTGIAQAAGGLTTPENIGLMAATGGVGEVPGLLGSLAKVGISGLLGTQMLKGAYDSIPGIQAARSRGDWGEVKRLATLAGLNVAMGAAALGHAGHAAYEGGAEVGGSSAESQRANSATVGHIGPAEEQLAPESPETLRAQVNALASGTNRVVYFPKGSEAIPPPPENANVTVVPGDQAGAGTYYHTTDLSPNQIRSSVDDGTFGSLLGNTQTKEEAIAGGKPAAVIARDESGNEVKAALADSTNPQAIAEQAAVLARQFPDAKIGVEAPEKVVSDRLGTAKPVSQSTREVRPDGSSVTTGAPGAAQDIFAMEKQLVDSGKIQQADIPALRRTVMDLREQHGTPGLHEDTYRALLRRMTSQDLPAGEAPQTAASRETPLSDNASTAFAPSEQGTSPAQDSSESGISPEGVDDRPPTQQNRLLMEYRRQLAAATDPDEFATLYARIKGLEGSQGSGQPISKVYNSEADAKAGVAGKEAQLRTAAQRVRAVDPALADHLEGLADGRFTDAQQLKDFAEGNIKNDPQTTAGLAQDFKTYDTETAGNSKSTGARITENPSEHQLDAPTVARYSPTLRSLSEDVRSKDPELSATLAQLADGDARALDTLRSYIEKKVPNGDESRRLLGLIDAARAESRAASTGKAENDTALRDVEGKPIKTGPGTPLKDSFDSMGTHIEQITKVIKDNAKGTSPITQRMDLAAEAARKMSSGKSASAGALNAVKSIAAAMIDAYRRPARWTGFEDSLGKYQGALQKSAFELRNFAKSVRDAVPVKTRREAISNWIEAGGDAATLKDWASRSKGQLKAGYEQALTLTPTEKTIARNLMSSQDERFQMDKEAGLLEHEVENYVMHAWKRENPYTKQLVSTVRAEMLKPNPSFSRERVFGTYFDGEQAGFAPADKDIGFLFAAREHSANEAIAARAFIRSLLEGQAQDGRPLASISGSGRQVEKKDAGAEAYFVDGKVKPDEIADYRSIDHPALRKWTWATSTEGKAPIFVRGDIVVHPEAYGKLRNVLAKSALRTLTIPGTDVQPFRIAQQLSSEFKSTMLSLSGFHQTQEGLHAIFHKVNPFTTESINLNDPAQMKLVEHGLQVASFDAQQQFGEGVSSGLVNKVPLVGKYFQKYNDYLFSDLIPRLKMTLAQEALQRNMKRYAGKLSEDEIYATTANQANAAFGELNYKMMARNPTFQDVLRMTLLAPDFLEARGRFVGQALKPYGREQALAIIRGALGLYVTARVANQLLNNDPHWDPQDAFSVIFKGKSYTLRSVPGDLLHLFTDPRGFIYNRLNPIYGKGAIEAITGRDQYGRKRDIAEQAKDSLRGAIPIPFQGLVKNSEGGGVAQTALTSTGVSTYPYRTPAERLARQFTLDNIPLGPESADRKDANRLAHQFEDQLRNREKTPEDLIRARQEGKITAADQQKILARAARTPLQNAFRSLTPEQALQVWAKATPEEKQQIRPLFANKLGGVEKLPAEKRTAIRDRITAALHQTASFAGIPRQAPASRQP